jgi:hypothetical protein
VAGEVSFQLTEEDCVATYRDIQRDRLSGRNPALSAFAMIASLAIAGAALVAFAFETWRDRSVSLSFPAILLLSAGFYWFCRLNANLAVARGARGIFKQRASFRRPMHYSWSEAGLGFRTDNSSGLIPWADLHRWRTGRHSYLFFTDDWMAYFIPRSALSEADTEDLETTLAASGVPGPPPLEDALIYA